MVAIESVVGNKKFYGSELRKKGRVEFSRFQKEIVPWFFENHYHFQEKEVSTKDAVSGLKEQKIRWDATRNVDSYFRFHIEVRIITFRSRQEDAFTVVRFKGYLEKDYRNHFDKYGKSGDTLRKIYEELVIKRKKSKMKNKIRDETHDLTDEIKKVLQQVVR